MSALTFGVFVALFALAHRRFGSVYTSPVQIVSGGLAALAVLGFVFYDSLTGLRGAAGIRIMMTPADKRSAFVLIMVTACAILSGAIATSLLTRQKRAAVRELEGIDVSDTALNIAVLLMPLPLILMLVGSGAGTIWRRDEYIINHLGGSLLSAGAAAFGLGAVAGLGFLWGKHKARVLVLVYAVAYLAVFFGTGSRRLALVPVLFGVGAFVANPTRLTRWALVPLAASSVYLIGLPLAMRTGTEHGILPYWNRLPAVLGGELPFAVTALNILVGFAIINTTAYLAPAFPTSDIWASLNPLPSSLMGWADIAPGHRLNYFTPYAGIGELGNAGWPYVLFVGAVLGVALCYLDLSVGHFIRIGQQAVALLLLCLTLVLLLFLTQYNLRAGFRMVYYGSAVAIFARWYFSALRPRHFPPRFGVRRPRTLRSRHSPPRSRGRRPPLRTGRRQ